ncbi:MULTISPECIES: HNH endonuclease domain-containing protein [Cyanophyceae]|uniref:HNH nuclease domain-containing protein n=1 Tax=Leptolyngbya subtilissima DQ-A4 TaxID=2933933 RepID=A0ABV0KC92_9CYAN|nr:HNH endonuclease domain-containing protein [Nodosilinea sp. FACHB-141]
MISTILKHDTKVTSYKIALLRAINDVVLTYPDLRSYQSDVAVPLKLLAEFWIAYYWPFVDIDQPIQQGQRAQRQGQIINNVAFRPALTKLRRQWEQVIGGLKNPADGFFLINELRSPRKHQCYPQLGTAFTCPWTEKRIAQGIDYNLDHILPIAVYPTNELWNLVPSDPDFNSHRKRDRLPTAERLVTAFPWLELAYSNYGDSISSIEVLQEDISLRFARVRPGESFATKVAIAVIDLVEVVAKSRNLARF